MDEYLKNVKDSRNYFTVSEYFRFLENVHGIKSPEISKRKNLYQGIEKECDRICSEKNIRIEKVIHLELGSLKKYPESLLAEVVFRDKSGL